MIWKSARGKGCDTHKLKDDVIQGEHAKEERGLGLRARSDLPPGKAPTHTFQPPSGRRGELGGVPWAQPWGLTVLGDHGEWVRVEKTRDGQILNPFSKRNKS